MKLRALFAVGATLAVVGAGALASPVLAAPALTSTPATVATAEGAGCTGPECLGYQGGAVQRSPRVVLLLWGPRWSASATAKKAYSYLYWFYKGLGTTADTWSPITSQYGDSAGAPGFGGPVLAAVYQDKNTPPGPVTPADVAAEAAKVPSVTADPADTQVVVASQPGTCFSDGFDGNPKGCATTTPDSYCGWHSTVGGVPYVNLPFQLDAGRACGENAVNAGSSGELDGFSITAGAEYADTITDPIPPTGWVATSSATASGGEIAAECAPAATPRGAATPEGDLRFGVRSGKTTVSFSFAVRSLWSNALGRCILTTRPALTVPVPRTQNATIGEAVRFQMPASTNTGTALAYAATGLPPGLSISATTGEVTGRPVSVTARIWQVTVTVSDPLKYAAAHTVSFRWQVNSPVGAMKGTWSKCVDDWGGITKSGAKIDLFYCDGTGPQWITFAGNGELRVDAHCITGGRLAYIEPCRGTRNQVWTRLANGEYVLKSNGKCLSDPGNSRRDGTQLRLLTCKGTVNQRWSLP